MCNLCNSLVLHCLYGGLGGLEGRRAWEKINDFIIITKCFVITFLPFLLEEKKGDTSDAHTYVLREGAMGIGRRRGRYPYKSLILYFCSQFWLCNHVSFNPLDQTWQMAPWQKEGGLRINHSGVPLWFMAQCAGSIEKGIGHILMFPAKRNTACCD